MIPGDDLAVGHKVAIDANGHPTTDLALADHWAEVILGPDDGFARLSLVGYEWSITVRSLMVVLP